MTDIKTNTTTGEGADIRADLVSQFKGRIKAIEARNVPHMNYVLMWPDCRFVGFPNGPGDPQIVGFERAAFFGDREAAAFWLKRKLTDGAGVAPEIVSAFNAKQSAIVELEKVIATVEASA